MDLKLKNKRVLVTGSTGGIGAGIAQRFAEEGATVAINGRRADAAEQVAATIREAGGKAIIALGDLSIDEEVDKVLAKIEAELGGVDILVNNAAGGGHQNDMETPIAEWMDSYNTNVLSMVRLIQKLLPAMQKQGWGRIINISSGASTMPPPGMGAYSVTKAAVNNLTVTLAQGMSNDNVTINTVSPGAIFTSSTGEVLIENGLAEDLDSARVAMNKMANGDIPFDRVGEVSEIANVVLFLSSPLASYVHGANIRVDGGYVPTVN
jgi:NAD(P)-dependent dehydrogenase (short-subunit alcohol dehydrogenase family)